MPMKDWIDPDLNKDKITLNRCTKKNVKNERRKCFWRKKIRRKQNIRFIL